MFTDPTEQHNEGRKLVLRDFVNMAEGILPAARASFLDALRYPLLIMRSGNTTDVTSAFCVAAAFVLWLRSLPEMDADQLDYFGLISILPPSYWAALALVTAGFAISLGTACRWTFLRPASVIILILMLHATPPIVYETLRYSWAWKHLGIVDYIQRHGHVDREAPFLAAYHNWPFFFWLSAKTADFLNLTSLEFANFVRFFPVASSLCFSGLLYAIFRRFTDDFRLAWTALWFFLCSNWVGQDYFSPQAFAFALYLLVLAICLGPLGSSGQVPPQHGLARRLYDIRHSLTRGTPKFPYVGPGLRIVSILVVCLAIWEMVAAHQLTPLILFNALLVLSLLSGLSLGYAAFTGLAVASWIIYPAAPFTSVELPEQIAGIMNAWRGITDKFVDTSVVDPRVAFVAWGGRILTLGVALLAGLGWIRRFRLGGRDGVVIGLAVAPLPIFLFTSYGGEIIFRVYLFCVPFLAIFAAALFYPTNMHGRNLRTRLTFTVVALLMACGFLLGNNGKDLQYRFSPAEVAGAHWLYNKAVPGTLLIEGARSYPSQFMNYENISYVPIDREQKEDLQEILADPARVLSRWLQGDRWTEGFVIITRSQKAYVDALGRMPKGELDRIEYELLSSSDFQLVFVNEDVRIFTLSSLVEIERADWNAFLKRRRCGDEANCEEEEATEDTLPPDGRQ